MLYRFIYIGDSKLRLIKEPLTYNKIYDVKEMCSINGEEYYQSTSDTNTLVTFSKEEMKKYFISIYRERKIKFDKIKNS